MVDKLSTRSSTAGVADGTTHKQATDGVEEWETASLRFLTHHGNDFLDPFRLRALVWSPCVHLGGLGPALARRSRLNAETLQELREFGAGAAATKGAAIFRRSLWFRSCLMGFLDRPARHLRESRQASCRSLTLAAPAPMQSSVYVERTFKVACVEHGSTRSHTKD